MVVFVRLLPAIVLAALAGVAIYQVGKRYGWWGKPQARHAASRKAPQRAVTPAQSAPGGHDEIDPSYRLVADLWQEARIQPYGTWLYTRDDRMLRISFATVGGTQTLYVEVLTAVEHGRRIKEGGSSVDLYTFTQGKGPTALVRTVLVKAEGAPDFELKGFAYDVAEGTPNNKPDDDALRRLKTDMQLASHIDDN